MNQILNKHITLIAKKGGLCVALKFIETNITEVSKVGLLVLPLQLQRCQDR